MAAANINTPDYWDNVYRKEWEAGLVRSDHYIRDYGPIHDAIVKLIRPGSRVLDIACGPGLLCRKIRSRVSDAAVTGIDFSPYTIEQNIRTDADLGIDYRVVDLRDSLDVFDGQFDVVIMCEILEHLDEPRTVLSNAMGVLREGGIFILTCPHADGIPDPEHVRDWDHDELFHVLSGYSPTVAFTHFPPPWYHVWMMAHLTKSSVLAKAEGLV